LNFNLSLNNKNLEQNNPTLIILHGWQSSKEKWQVVKENLEKQGLKVIVPDLPGFKKENELNRSWNLDNYLRWFEKFSSEISEPFFLLGHSFGGRMAIKFAAQHPEKLKGLILVSAAGIKHKKTFKQNLFFKMAKTGKKFSFLPFFSFFRKAFYKFIVREKDYARAQGFLKETFKKIIAEDLTPYFLKIKISTLIIWGEKDKMTSLSDAYLMNKKIPNSKLEILKKIGHLPYREAPEILAEKIINFVK
jgi:pimeloyl-ACP methyl ester carboxylesterase